MEIFKVSGPNKMTQALDNIAEKMTTQEIAEAQRLAREWKPAQTKLPAD